MNTNNIKTPVGLTAAVAAVKKNQEQAHIYYRCGLKPPHYIINLDAGNGQTTLTEYITESFAAYKVRPFRGLDMFLEYTLNGSMEQLKKMFSDIRACAIYTNEFEGIVAIDISKLASYINETQVSMFVDEIAKISAQATLLLYVPSSVSRNTTTLIGKIYDALDNVEILNVAPYSTADLVGIVKSMVADAGVELEESSKFDKLLLSIVIDERVTNIKGAKKLSQMMIKNANYKGFVPKCGTIELKHTFQSESKNKMGVK